MANKKNPVFQSRRGPDQYFFAQGPALSKLRHYGVPKFRTWLTTFYSLSSVMEQTTWNITDILTTPNWTSLQLLQILLHPSLNLTMIHIHWNIFHDEFEQTQNFFLLAQNHSISSFFDLTKLGTSWHPSQLNSSACNPCFLVWLWHVFLWLNQLCIQILSNFYILVSIYAFTTTGDT